MSDKQIIAASIQVDFKDANEKVKEFNVSVNKAKDSLKDTGATVATTGKQIEGGTVSFSKLKDKMSELPGPLGAAGEGVNKLGATFKALLANPIVLLIAAIVAGLALLYKAFTNTFEGGEKMEQVFSGIKAAAQSLFDNLGHIGSAIVKFFQFDFSGAVAEIKGVAKAAGDAYNAMADLTKKAQEIHREQLANDLDQANRAKQLAILREQSTDDSISPAQRKAALLELRKAAEDNAKQDIKLAKETADNIIAQKSLEKDGAKKNQDEINAARIQQIQVETDNANELRRIDKQITAAGKQEQAERNEAIKAAGEAAKAQSQKTIDFNNNLRKLQHDNEIAAIKDDYQKEVKQLEIKTAEEKRVNDQAYKDGKISKEQARQIEEQIDIQFFIAQDALTTKHNADLAKIEDDRKKKKEEQQKKDDEQKAKAEALAKIAAKNIFELEDQKQKAIVDAKNADFQAKIDAVNAEQDLVKKAFDDKVITELDYNNKVAELANKRMEIADLESGHQRAQVEEIKGILTNLADIVGKQTIAGKALGIATALINTYQGASEAIKQKSTLPSPFDVVAKIVSVAAVIATGLKTVKAIASVQVPGGGGGGSIPNAPSISALSPAAPVAPSQSSTNISNTDELNNSKNAAVRAFVVDYDAQTNRERTERLSRAARLGG